MWYTMVKRASENMAERDSEAPVSALKKAPDDVLKKRCIVKATRPTKVPGG